MSYQKMYMIPAEDPTMINLFKGRLVEDPTLDTAAKLMSRKMSILKNLKTSQAFKKQAIKQIDPDIELNIKKLRQLPASLSVNADPSKLAKVLEDEEGDLVTPVQQKLLKRIFNQVTLKQEPTTTPRRAPKKEFVTPSTIPFQVPKKEATVTPPVRVPKKEVTATPPVKVPKKPENVSWDELTFAEEGPEPDLEGVVSKTLRKIWKTPQYVKNLRPAKGWTSWDPTGIRKKKKRSILSSIGFIGSAAKDLVVSSVSSSSSSGRTRRRRSKKKKGVWGSVIKPVGSIAKKLIFDDDT